MKRLNKIIALVMLFFVVGQISYPLISNTTYYAQGFISDALNSKTLYTEADLGKVYDESSNTYSGQILNETSTEMSYKISFKDFTDIEINYTINGVNGIIDSSYSSSVKEGTFNNTQDFLIEDAESFLSIIDKITIKVQKNSLNLSSSATVAANTVKLTTNIEVADNSRIQNQVLTYTLPQGLTYVSSENGETVDVKDNVLEVTNFATTVVLNFSFEDLNVINGSEVNINLIATDAYEGELTAVENVQIAGEMTVNIENDYIPEAPKALACDAITASEGTAGEPQCNSAPIIFENPSFEEPIITDSRGFQQVPYGDVPGWTTTEPAGTIEMWNNKAYDDLVGVGFPDFPDGNQGIELNAYKSASVYQDFVTTEGQEIYYSLYHGNRTGNAETMNLLIGAPVDPITDPENPTTADKFSPTEQDRLTDKGAWHRITGTYTVPSGQPISRIAFGALEEPGINVATGNLLDNIEFTTKAVYDNIVEVIPPVSLVDYNQDVFTINNSLVNIQGDAFINSSVIYDINQDVEVVSATMSVDGVTTDITSEITTDDTGDAHTTLSFDGLPEAKNANIEIKVRNTGNLTPGGTTYGGTSPYNMQVTSTFKFYSAIEYLEDDTSPSYTVADKSEASADYVYNKIVPTKSVSDIAGKVNGIAEEGDTLHYTINLDNTGTVTQHDVVVVDPLDDRDLALNSVTNLKGAKNGAFLTTPTDYQVNAADKTVTIASVDPTSNYAITFDVVLNKLDTSSDVTNTTEVVETAEYPGVSSGTADATISKDATIDPTDPNIDFTKVVTGGTGSGGTAKPGDTLTYTYTINNKVSTTTKSGIELLDLTLTDPLDDPDIDSAVAPVFKSAIGNTVGDITPTGDLKTGLKLGAIPGGEQVVVVYEVTAGEFDTTTVINTTSTIKALNLDSPIEEDETGIANPDIAKDLTLDPTTPEKYMKLTKDATDTMSSRRFFSRMSGDGIADLDEIINYTITFKNTSSVALKDVKIIDPLDDHDLNGSIPTNLKIYDGTDFLTTADYTITGKLLSINTVPSGAVYTITFDVPTSGTFDETEFIENTAIVLSTANTGNIDPTAITASKNIPKNTDIPPGDPLEPKINKEVKDVDTDIDSDSDSVIDGNADGVVSPKEGLHYKYTITNPSSVKAKIAIQNAVLTDPLDDPNLNSSNVYNLTATSTDSTHTFNLTGADIKRGIPLGDIQTDEVVKVEFDVFASDVFDNNPTIDTTAALTGDNIGTILETTTYDGTTDTTSDIEKDFTPELEKIDITKTGVGTEGSEADTLSPDEDVIYTVEVTNNNAVPITNVVLEDRPDDDLTGEITFDKVTTDGTTLSEGDDYTLSPITNKITLLEIPANTTYTITFSMKTGEFDTTEFVENTAAIISLNLLSGQIISEPSQLMKDLSVDKSDIKLTKSVMEVPGDGDDKADPAESLYYTIWINNNSSVPLTGVVLKDPLDDPNLDLSDTTIPLFIFGIPSFSATIGDLQAGITLDTINPGMSIGVSFTIPTKTAYNSNTTIDNKARITETDNTGPMPLFPIVTEASIDIDTELTADDFTISKSVDDLGGVVDGKAEVGETLKYSIDVTNTSGLPAKNVVVSDPLTDLNLSDTISNFKITNGVTDLGSSDYTTNKVDSLTIYELPPFTTYTIIIEIPAATTFDGAENIENTATIVSASNVADPINKEATASIPKYTDITDPTTAMTISKEVSDDDGVATLSEPLHYKITYKNTSAVTLEDVVIQDDLGDPNLDTSDLGSINLTIIGSSVTATAADLQAGLNIGSVASGAEVTIEFDINTASIFDASKTIDNTATIVSTSNTSGIGNLNINSPVASIDKDLAIDPTDPAKPTLTKEVTEKVGDGDNKADPSETLHYKYVIDNPTPVKSAIAVKNAVLKDPLNDSDLDTSDLSSINLTITGSSATGTVADLQSGINLGDISSGSSVTVEFDINAKDAFDSSVGINTTANVKGDNTFTIFEENILAEDILKDLTVDPTTDLAITKAVHGKDGDADSVAVPKEVLTYTVTVENKSDVSLTNVALQDVITDFDLDEGSLKLISVKDNTGADLTYSSASYDSASSTYGITIDEIPVGKSAIITFTLNAASIFDASETIDNVATIVTTDNTSSIDPININSPVASIEKDLTIDPGTDPTADGILFTKEVKDVDTTGTLDNTAQPGEILTYTYTLTNDSDSGATLPLVGITLTDPLSDSDPDVFLPALSDISISQGGVDITGDTSKYAIDGANKKVTFTSPLEVDQSIEVKFITLASTTFDSTPVIDTTAVVTASNYVDTSDLPIAVEEIGTTYDGTSDTTSDIVKDLTIDPADVDVEFTKAVTDTGSGALDQADPGEVLNYEYNITNKGNVALTGVILKDPFDDISGAGDVDLNPDSVSVIVGENSVDGDLTIDSSQKILTGVSLGDIEKGETVTVTFTVKASSTFDATEVIDTTANITASNVAGASLEEDDSAAGASADIEKNMTIDPTDVNVSFTKAVTDTGGATPGEAELSEELNYEYKITNKGNVALTGVTLTDPFDDIPGAGDVDLNPDSVSIIVGKNSVDGDLTIDSSQKILTGVSLGDIEKGETVTVTFTVAAADVFDATDVINTTSFITASNYTDVDSNLISINEDDSAATPADIAKNKTIDPGIDPAADGIILTKTVSDTSTDGLAQPSELLHYTYTIENNPVTKANTPLENVTLVDPLGDKGLGGDADLSTALPVEGDISVKSGGADIPFTTSGNSIILTNPILTGESVIVEFDILASDVFDSTPTIDTTATVTASNYVDTSGLPIAVEEIDTTYGIDGDTTSDIVKDLTIDPADVDVEFTKAVTDTPGFGVDDQADPGEVLNYEYNITNKGNVALTGVILKDPFDDISGAGDVDLNPDSVSVIAGENSVDGDLTIDASQKILTGVSLGDIEKGETVTVTFTVEASSIFDATKEIDTTAFITASNVAGVSLDEDDSAATVKDIEKNLTVDPTDVDVIFTKAVNESSTGDADTLADPSEVLDYTYTIINDGDVALTDVTLTDPFDDIAGAGDVDLNPGSVSAITGKNSVDGDLTIGSSDKIITGVSLGDIEKGETVTVTFTVAAADVFDATEVIDTTATITATNYMDASSNLIPINEDDSAATPADIEKDLTIDPGTDPTADGILFTKEVLGADTTGTFDRLAQPGEVLTYTYTLTNDSASGATLPLEGITLTDPLSDSDPDVSLPALSDISISQGGADITGDTSKYAIDGTNKKVTFTSPLEVGQSIEVKFTTLASAIFDSTPVIDTTAVVTATNYVDSSSSPAVEVPIEEQGTTYGIDGDTTSDIVKDLTIDPTDVNVEFTKAVTDTPGFGVDNQADPGEVLNYEYNITNKGNVALTGVILKDPFDDISGAGDVDLNPDSVSVIAGKNSVDGDLTIDSSQKILTGVSLGDIEKGETVTVTFTVKASSTFDATEVIDTAANITASNVAGASLEEDDSLAAPTQDIAKNLTIAPADVDVTFTKAVTDAGGATPGQAELSEELNYEYNITNNGSVALQEVILTEPLDSEDPDVLSSVSLLEAINSADGAISLGLLPNVKSGINLGDIEKGETVTVTFTVNAANVFDATDVINTTSNITASNISTSIDEDDSAATPADILKSTKVDVAGNTPTLTKEVRDGDDELAQKSETLHYKYIITNPSKILKYNVAVQDAVLKDPLGDPDLNKDSIGTITATSSDSDHIIDTTSANITSGISLGKIAPDEEITVEFDINTAASFDATSEIDTTSTLTGSNIDDVEETNSPAVVGGLADIPKDLTIDPTDVNIVFTKGVTDAGGVTSGKAELSETLNYEYNITNKGTSGLQGVVLTDPLGDPDLDKDSIGPITATSTDPAHTIDTTSANIISGVNLGGISPGETVTVTFTINANDKFDATEVIDTTATITATNYIDASSNLISTNEDDSAATPADIEKDMTITSGDLGGTFTKAVIEGSGADGDDKADRLEELSYTYTITNTGDLGLQGVVLTDPLGDPDLDKDSIGPITATSTVSSHTINTASANIISGVNLGGISPGETVTVTFTINANDKFDATEVIDTTSFITATNYTDVDSNLIPINEDDSVALGGVADIEKDMTITSGDLGVTFTKAVVEGSGADGDDKADRLEELSYTYTITNTGDLGLQGVVLTDPLGDSDLDTSSTSISSITATSTDSTHTIDTASADIISGVNLGGISPGETITVTFTINAANIFDATEVIDTTAFITATNYTDASSKLISINEDDSVAPGGVADIEKDMTITSGDLDGTFTKSVTDAGGVTAGKAEVTEKLSYTYTIENTGDLGLQGVVLTDPLGDPDLNAGSIDAITATSTDSTHTINTASANIISGVNLGGISPGETITVTFTINAAATFDATEVIDTTATITAANYTDASSNLIPIEEIGTTYGVDGNTTSDILKDTSIDPTNPTTAMTIDKVGQPTDGNSSAEVGEALSYTITFTNTSSVALTNVKIEDTPDGEITNYGNLEINGSTYPLSNPLILDEVPAGETYTITYTAKATSTFDTTPSIDNEIQVVSTDNTGDISDTSVTPESNQIKDSASISKDTSLIGTPDDNMNITKTVTDTDDASLSGTPDGKVQPDEELEYQIEFENTSSVPLTGVVIEDTFDSDASSVVGGSLSVKYGTTLLTSPADYTVSSNTITLNTVPAGAIYTITFRVTSNSRFNTTDAIVNQVAVTETENTGSIPEVDQPNNESTIEDATLEKDTDIEVDPSNPDVALIYFTKVVDDSTGNNDGIAQAGELLHYTYELTNSVPIRAFVPIIDATIQDPLDDEINTSSIDALTVKSSKRGPITPTGDIINGLKVGDIIPNEIVTVEFNVNAASTFDASDEINTTAKAWGTNTSAKIIEDDSTATSIPDIKKDKRVDPLDPDAPVLFTKTVTDASGDNIAQPSEELTYTYTVENVAPVKSVFPLTNVILVDDILSETDLDATSASDITITKASGTSTKTVNDLATGIDLGEIPVGGTTTATFTISTINSFVDLNPINTEAEVELVDNGPVTIGEVPNGAGGYTDEDDIAKDTSKGNLVISHKLVYDGDVSGATTPTTGLYTAPNPGDFAAQPGERLVFELKLDNSDGIVSHTVTGNINPDILSANEIAVPPVGSQGYYYGALDLNDGSAPTERPFAYPTFNETVGAGQTLTLQYYIDLDTTWSDIDDITNQIDITDEVGGSNIGTVVPEITVPKREGSSIQATSVQVCSSTKANTVQELVDMLLVSAYDTDGSIPANSNIKAYEGVPLTGTLISDTDMSTLNTPGSTSIYLEFEDSTGTLIQSSNVTYTFVSSCSDVKSYEVASGNEYYNPPLYVAVGGSNGETDKDIIGDVGVDLYDDLSSVDEKLCVYIKDSSETDRPSSTCDYPGDKTDGAVDLELISTGNFDINTIGTYYPVYSGQASTGELVSGKLEVRVIEPQMFAIDDTQVREPFAPKSGPGLRSIMDARAVETSEVIDSDGVNHIGDYINEGIKVSDFGAYNTLNPKVGDYMITFESTSPYTGIVVEDTAILEVVPGYVDVVHNGDLIANSPIAEQASSGSYETLEHAEPISVLYEDNNLSDAYNEIGIKDDNIQIVNSVENELSGNREFLLIQTSYNNLRYQDIVEVQKDFKEEPITDEIKLDANSPVIIDKDTDFDPIVTTNAHATNSKGDAEEVKVYASRMYSRDRGDEPYQVVLYSQNDEAVGVELVDVIEKDIEDGNSPIIVANDAHARSSFAPDNAAELIELMNARAIDVDGTDISEDIEVYSLGDYTYGNGKLTGNPYEITFGVKSPMTGEVVTVTQDLSIIGNQEKLPRVELVGNSPIYVKLDDGTEVEDITKLIDPEILLYINQELEDVIDTDIEILTTDGYDNSREGTYYFAYEGTYDEPKSDIDEVKAQNIFEVIVTDDIEQTMPAIQIEANEDMVVALGSTFDPIKTPEVKATSMKDGDITEKVEVLSNTVDTSKVGEYTVSYYVKDSKGLEAFKNIKVTVTDEDEEELDKVNNAVDNDDNNSIINNINKIDKDSEAYQTLVNTAKTSIWMIVILILSALFIRKKYLNIK